MEGYAYTKGVSRGARKKKKKKTALLYPFARPRQRGACILSLSLSFRFLVQELRESLSELPQACLTRLPKPPR